MLGSTSRVLSRGFKSSTVALKEVVAAPITGKLNELTLNFALPHRALVNRKEIKRVTLPAREGMIGVEKNSPPFLPMMRPGVVRVDHIDGSVEEFFVPGGFAFKHANNSMDLSAPEAIKLEHVDNDALRAANSEAVKKLAGAAAGSREAAEAKISLEVYSILAKAVKVTL